MSDQYYDNEVLNASVLVEGVVWQQIENVAGYESDNYLTADEGCNETQYFSMLDSCSNGNMLNDISGIAELNGYDESMCSVNTQPAFYRVEGSDDLFAFDITCDDDGNLQRMNDNGDYEAVPESFELVSLDEDETIVEGSQEVAVQQPAEPKHNQTLVKKEMLAENDTCEPRDLPFEECDNLPVNENTEDIGLDFVGECDDGYESCSRIMDSKIGILEHQPLLPINKVESISHCKVENTSFEHFDESVDNSFDTNNDNIEQINLCSFENGEHINDDTILPSLDESEDMPSNQIELEHNSVQPQHVFLAEHHENIETELSLDSEINNNSSRSTSGAENTDESDFNESDDEEYEIVEGDHVTGDSEQLEQSTSLVQDDEPISPGYVLEVQQQMPIVAEPKHTDTAPPMNLVKTNPRSLLRSSYIFIEQKEKEIEKPEVIKIDKRFLKNKEFVQARLFSNYIAQTKILHAPIRQHRLPRKQTIQPVQRNDEEIIVQEVVVSSKGFVETHEDGIFKSKIPLKATEIVHLSDSDEDYKPKRNKYRKKSKVNKVKDVKIVISDSDDEACVQANVPSDSEDVPIKKRRGRPPKRSTDIRENLESPTEKENHNSTNIHTNACTIKTRWKCHDCPKNFPSEGSLKSHMQLHNFSAPKYECINCSATFKNNILLTKHMQIHNPGVAPYLCLVCKKTFTSHIDFTHHKRIHFKTNMVKATDVLKCSPKSINKSPVKHHNVCHFCLKSFSTVDLLKAHEKIHKRFSCITCPLKFESKLLLENHVRNKCVKLLKRGSVIPRPKPSTSLQDNFKKPQSSAAKLALSCDNCTNKFSSFKALYKHKILVHNFNTPDKHQIMKEHLSGGNVRKSTHTNIPANDKLRNAYAHIRSRLEL